MVPHNASRSREAGGTGPRGAGGSSSVVDPETAAAVDCGTFHAARTERLFRRPARSFPSPATLSLSSSATGFDQDDAAGLATERALDSHLLEKRMLLEAAVRMHPPDAAIRAARLSPRLQPAPAARAAPAQALEPGILTPAVPAPERRHKSAGCAREAAPRHACCRTPLLRANCADAAAVCGSASRLLSLRLCLSACGARQASPLHSYRRDRVHCMDAAAIQLPLPLQLSLLIGSVILEEFLQ